MLSKTRATVVHAGRSEQFSRANLHTRSKPANSSHFPSQTLSIAVEIVWDAMVDTQQVPSGVSSLTRKACS